MASSQRGLLIVVAAGFAVLALVVHQGFSLLANSDARVVAAYDGANARAPSAEPVPSMVSSPQPPIQDSASVERDHDNHIAELLRGALTQQRPLYISTCVRPNSTVMPVELDLVVTLDAQGHETHRDLTPKGAQPQMVECLRRLKVPPVSIEPPGKATTLASTLYVP